MRVLERFAQTQVMFAVDSLVTGTVNAFNNSLDWINKILPIPGMESLLQLVRAVIKQATTFVDETILSYTLARGDSNVWRSSMDGLVYYAVNAKAILKTAAMCVLVQWISLFVLFLICLVPSYIISLFLPSSVSGYAWVFAVALAGAFKAAILDPVFLTMVALTFHRNVHGQAINEGMADTLASLTDKFGELKKKALEYAGRADTATTAEVE